MKFRVTGKIGSSKIVIEFHEEAKFDFKKEDEAINRTNKRALHESLPNFLIPRLANKNYPTPLSRKPEKFH